MGRFQKHYSNYTLRKRHQTINGGVITERDWTTLGERFRFGPNKRAMYADGNFLFTSSSVSPYPKRKKTFITSNAYTYDDVEYSTDDVNTVAPNINTNDIRTFAYYGSCVELVRASVENIIAEFPACITVSTQQLTYYKKDEEGYQPIPISEDDDRDPSNFYLIRNPFNIDLYHKNVSLGKYDNPYRFLSTSWNEYSINGDPITKYEISDWQCRDEQTGENLGNCECQYDRFLKPVLKIDIETTEALEEDSNAEPITHNYVLYGYLVNNNIVFTTYKKSEDSTEETDDSTEGPEDSIVILKPNDDVIEDYFSSLEGFEKQLLNRKTEPLYKNSFITPIMGELNYQYYERPYIWPTMADTDYCLDIESVSYITFINSLTELATLMDELWTDNLYRNMTHEAIKNFDWTYTREYSEGEEQDNIDGGERMQKILHIFARLMDDSKRYIDAIQYANKVTYCSYDDMPNAVVSDKLGYQGWDYTSTIPSLTDEDGNVIDISNTTVDEEFLSNDKYVTKEDPNDEMPKWFPAGNTDIITPSYVDIDFSRKLLLSSAHIWRTKGTRQAIEMVMGMFGFGLDIDYTLTEKYYVATPRKADEEMTFEDDGPKAESTLRNFITNANLHKGLPIYSEDYFSGLPLNELSFLKRDENGEPIKVDGEYQYEDYIIPYFDQSKYDVNEPYDGDLLFQQKGGWSKMLEDDENEWDLADANYYDEWRHRDSSDEGDGTDGGDGTSDTDECGDGPYCKKELLSHIDYKETLSYLHILSNISDLLNVNSREVQGGEIYYVVNINDFMDYYEAEDDTVFNYTAITHFFMFKYGEYDTSVFSSWQNISFTDGVNDYDENIARKAQYLDSLLTTTFGNNPHTGYGQYDCGVNFLEYLQKPFKYSLDEFTISGLYDDKVLYSTIADDIEFTISEPHRTSDGDDKLQIITQYATTEGKVDPIATQKETDAFREKSQFINSKVLVMENLVAEETIDEQKNYLYREYFLNVILPYVMQVIPSTTILVLKNYSVPYADAGEECIYENPFSVSCGYTDISADGGTAVPLVTYSQLRTCGDEKTTISDGATLSFVLVKDEEKPDEDIPTNVTINETTGEIIYNTANESTEPITIANVQVSVTLNGCTVTCTCTVTQEGAGVSYTYDNPHVDVSYPKIPYDGTTDPIMPVYSYSQTRRGNDGSEVIITNGGSLSFALVEAENGNSSNGTFTINSQTGALTYDGTNDTSDDVTLPEEVQLTVTMNNKNGSSTSPLIQGVQPEYTYAFKLNEFYYQDYQDGEALAPNVFTIESHTVSPTISFILEKYSGDTLIETQTVTPSRNNIHYLCVTEASSSWISVNFTNGTATIAQNGTTDTNWADIQVQAYYTDPNGTTQSVGSTIEITQLANSEVVTYTERLTVTTFLYNHGKPTLQVGGTYLPSELIVLYQKINNVTGWMDEQYVISDYETTFEVTSNETGMIEDLDEPSGTIDIGFNTYRSQRESTVSVDITHVTEEGHTLTVTRTTTVTQEQGELVYSLEIEDFYYNSGHHLTAMGSGMYFPTLKVNLLTTCDGTTNKQEITIPEANCAYQSTMVAIRNINTYTGRIIVDTNTTGAERHDTIYFEGTYVIEGETLTVYGETEIIQDFE